MAESHPTITRVPATRFAKAIVDHDASLADALRAINGAATGLCLVVSNSGLHGVLSDGDIRRAMLGGAVLTDPVVGHVETRPVVVHSEDPMTDVAAIMVARKVPMVPIVDVDGRPLGLYAYRDLVDQETLASTAVIMAGGRGTRMGDLTKDTPKPMLAVAGRPILERIINRLVAQQLRTIAISVNYKADVIMDYFGDGEAFGCSIEYLIESAENPLGTAGSLSLLDQSRLAEGSPILVTNGDVLCDVDVSELVAHHGSTDAAMTVCTTSYNHTVPYGVVATDGDSVTAVAEKPIATWQVNAGVYALAPAVLEYVPKGAFCQMTDLVGALHAAGRSIAHYPIPGFWFDVGEPKHIERAENAAAIHVD